MNSITDVKNKDLLRAIIRDLKLACQRAGEAEVDVALLQLGVAFGLWHPLEAETLIPEDLNLVMGSFPVSDYKVVEEPEAFYVWGGG